MGRVWTRERNKQRELGELLEKGGGWKSCCFFPVSELKQHCDIPAIGIFHIPSIQYPQSPGYFVKEKEKVRVVFWYFEYILVTLL